MSASTDDAAYLSQFTHLNMQRRAALRWAATANLASRNRYAVYCNSLPLMENEVANYGGMKAVAEVITGEELSAERLVEWWHQILGYLPAIDENIDFFARNAESDCWCLQNEVEITL